MLCWLCVISLPGGDSDIPKANLCARSMGLFSFALNSTIISSPSFYIKDSEERVLKGLQFEHLIGLILRCEHATTMEEEEQVHANSKVLYRAKAKEDTIESRELFLGPDLDERRPRVLDSFQAIYLFKYHKTS